MISREVLILEYLDGRGLRPLGGEAQWRARFPSLGREAIDATFPFLGAFLEDAEALWTGPADGEIESGYAAQAAPGGEEVHLRATAVRGGALRLLILVRDEEGFRKRQAILQRGREARFALERRDREADSKEVLVHCIIHDLGGPLATMVGALSLLEEQDLSSRVREIVATALAAASRQEALIEEILQAFVAEREAVEVAEVNLLAVARAAVGLLRPAAEQRRVALSLSAEQGSFQVAAEESRLMRVLLNLLENALRHSPEGGVITLSLTAADGATVEVADEGPGVSPEQAPRLFEKLFQAGDRMGKAGLGLYFCRITIEKWGGRIGYRPRPGGGACFWFRLPHAPHS